MKYKKLVLPILLMAVMFTGACSTQSFLIKGGGSSVPTEKGWNHFFVQGIGQKGKIDAAAICGGADKIAKVESKYTVGNWFLQAITFGIYTPRQYKIYCIGEPENNTEQSWK